MKSFCVLNKPLNKKTGEVLGAAAVGALGNKIGFVHDGSDRSAAALSYLAKGVKSAGASAVVFGCMNESSVPFLTEQFLLSGTFFVGGAKLVSVYNSSGKPLSLREEEYISSLVFSAGSEKRHGGEIIEIKSAADLPDPANIKEIKEPWVKGEIILPKSMIGNVLNLINEKRGHQTNLSYIEDRAVIDFEAPMANLLTDFYDQLKSATSGYASFNYELNGYKPEDLVRVDFLVGGHRIDALSVMAHRSEAEAIGREVTKKLKQVIPRQNFEVALQAAIGARIIARETIGAYRKDVTVKIHTGDRDRKAKLLEKQKRGKARMKRFGNIDIPSEAFTVMLKRD